MKISSQAEIIKSALKPWAIKDGGTALVASDLRHLWEIAYQQTVGPRAILCYEGEAVRGDFSVAAALGRVDRQWILAVTRGRGFNADRGDSLTKTVQNSRPFYDLVEEARDIIRGLQGISVDAPVDFRSIEAMQKLDDLMDAYFIRFSVATDLPRMTCDGDGNVIPDAVGTPDTVQYALVASPCQKVIIWGNAAPSEGFILERAHQATITPEPEDSAYGIIAQGTFPTGYPGFDADDPYYIDTDTPVGGYIFYRVQAYNGSAYSIWIGGGATLGCS